MKRMVLPRSRQELARLNHIFIPAKKADRDRFRKSAVGRMFRPLFSAYSSLSQDGRVMFLVTILIGFAGLDVMQSQVHVLFAILAGIVIASVAARPFFRPGGLTLRVQTPARVAVGQAQSFLVTLTNGGPRRLVSLRVEGPFLPWDGRWERPAESISVLEPQASSSTLATARFSARGEHHLDAFESGVLVPFGFAIGPRRASNGARFLVVPKIARVTQVSDIVHALPRTRDAKVLSNALGEAEFAAVRPYRAGDPVKHLHARTWARTGVPHVKSYVAERSERTGVAVAVDGRLATEAEKEGALSLAAGVVACLVEHRTTVASMVIDAKSIDVEPHSGRAVVEACLDRLAVHELTQEEEPVLQSLEQVAPRLSSLVFISADRDPRRAVLVEKLRRAGVPVKWIVVSADEGASDVTQRASCVLLSRIEKEEPIRI